jgi:PAP2 superfamily
MTTAPVRVPARFLIIAVLAVLALLIGVAAQRTSAGSAAAAGRPATTATVQAAVGCPKATGGDSQVPCIPSRYPDAQVGDLTTQVTASEAQADQVAATWLADHPKRDDKAFLAFALTQVGTPPTAEQQATEIAALHKIADTRTKDGLKTSAWLEVHGKKDIWTLLRTQYRLGVSKAAGKTLKKQTDLAYALANTLAGQAKAQVKRPSPYVVDPTLDGQNQAKFAGKVRYSFPSKHAVISAAEVAVLGAANPADRDEYLALQAQIDYSRLYAGGHYASDIIRGAFLGQLAGDYSRSVLGAAHAAA